MKNITYIISRIDKSVAFEWIATHLDRSKFNLSFILLNDKGSELELFLIAQKIPVHRVKYSGKKDALKALITIRKILIKERSHVVHAHLFDATIIGLCAARFRRIKKRIYTRHHSTFHHEYHPRMIKYDRLCNFLATDIVAVSQNVLEILKEKENVTPSKIHLIHHGFDINAFGEISEERVQLLREKYNRGKNAPVIGVISRYTEWKGIQFIIPAFIELLKKYPKALLLIANANGDYKKEIRALLENVPKNNFIEITFEKDIFALYKLMDIYVHVPMNSAIEAFGQTYVESLASSIPSIFTLSGIAREFILDRQNALVVNFKDADSIYSGLIELLTSAHLKDRLILNGKKDVNKLFYLDKMISSLTKLYE